MEVDWASLHKILSDTTRRGILELLAERESLSYTDIMTLLQITNTGRLNYHLKALASLISKDKAGKYHLTEQGRQAAGLLNTFPERVPPERRLTGLKVMTAAVLILLGLLLIAAFAGALYVAAPITVGTSNHASLGPEAIPQNTTVFLFDWHSSAGAFSLSWSAASPVTIFVLNQTQYDALLLSHTTGAQSPPVLSNFTGTPKAWVAKYDQQSGNVSLSAPQGQYSFYAWSQGNTLLDSFGVAQSQSVGSSLSPFQLLYAAVFLAVGALPIVLAVSILTHRVWR
ncbi:MAG: winged helix-turn-helix transcriptional regulator [Nitrososphaerota archaeon]|nr:winged helix-turn-helix transcriptional regulator [Nitrososphaerota archaeon]